MTRIARLFRVPLRIGQLDPEAVLAGFDTARQSSVELAVDEALPMWVSTARRGRTLAIHDNVFAR